MTDEPRYNVNFHNDADIAAAVDQNVPRELISERSAGNNNTLSYLKGDIDVDALNRIFGPLGWGMVASPPQIDRFEDETGITVHTSGMPYIRTLNSKNIIDEIGLFIGAALLVTSLIFFFFFRSVVQLAVSARADTVSRKLVTGSTSALLS